MGIWERIRNLWALSDYDIPVIQRELDIRNQKAEFIMPNKVEEIFNNGGNIDEALK